MPQLITFLSFLLVDGPFVKSFQEYAHKLDVRVLRSKIKLPAKNKGWVNLKTLGRPDLSKHNTVTLSTSSAVLVWFSYYYVDKFFCPIKALILFSGFDKNTMIGETPLCFAALKSVV